MAHFYYPDIAPDTFKIAPVDVYTLHRTKEMSVEIVGDYKTTTKRLDMRNIKYLRNTPINIQSPRLDKFARLIEINGDHFIACFDLVADKIRKFPVISLRDQFTLITVLLGDILIIHNGLDSTLSIYYDFINPNGRVDTLKNVCEPYMARDNNKLAGVFIMNNSIYVLDLQNGNKRRLGSAGYALSIYGKTLHYYDEKSSIIYPSVFNEKRYVLPKGHWNGRINTLFCEDQSYVILDKIYIIPRLNILRYPYENMVAAVIDKHFIYSDINHIFWSIDIKTGKTYNLCGPIKTDQHQQVNGKLIVMNEYKLVIFRGNSYINILYEMGDGTFTCSSKYIYITKFATGIEIVDVYDWGGRFIQRISGDIIGSEYIRNPSQTRSITFTDVDIY